MLKLPINSFTEMIDWLKNKYGGLSNRFHKVFPLPFRWQKWFAGSFKMSYIFCIPAITSHWLWALLKLKTSTNCFFILTLKLYCHLKIVTKKNMETKKLYGTTNCRNKVNSQRVSRAKNALVPVLWNQEDLACLLERRMLVW